MAKRTRETLPGLFGVGDHRGLRTIERRNCGISEQHELHEQRAAERERILSRASFALKAANGAGVIDTAVKGKKPFLFAKGCGTACARPNSAAGLARTLAPPDRPGFSRRISSGYRRGRVWAAEFLLPAGYGAVLPGALSSTARVRSPHRP